jgi:hypothetical protein
MSSTTTIPPLWINQPSILYDWNEIMELWPLEEMHSISKINAITRMILILSLVGIVITGSMTILFICFLSLLFLYFLAKSKYQQEPTQIESFVDKDIYQSSNEVIPSQEEIISSPQLHLWNQYEEEQMNRVFLNTKINHDQQAFGNFLYGDMTSSKESTIDGAIKRVSNNSRYLLY